MSNPEIAVWHVNYAFYVLGAHWTPAVMTCKTHRSAVMESARMRADERYAYVTVTGPFYQEMPA